MSELDYMDALAAEYVLGSLDSEERTRARTLLEADRAFAATVELWERRFGELHLMVEPVEPDSTVWARIKAKMPEVRQQNRVVQPAMPASVPETTTVEPSSLTPAEPPSVDAIEAAISEAATTLSAEAAGTTAAPESQAPPAEVTPTSVSEASPAPASPAISAPVAEAPPASEVAGTSAVEAMPTPPVAATAAATAAPVLEAPSETRPQAVEPTVLSVRRQLRRWRAFAILMTLVIVALAALLAAWRFAPDRVPAMLQPPELMRQIGVSLPTGPAPRRPAPPESQFDE